MRERGPSIKFDFVNWEKHPIETLHLDYCKRILKSKEKHQTMDAGQN